MDLRDYELMYIVRPTLGDEEFPGAIERVDTLVTNLGGEVNEKNPWGKRRLAYPIEKHEDGYYVVAKIKLSPIRAKDLEEQLRITDEVIRHILVQPAEQKKGRPAPPQAEAPAAQAQAAAPIEVQATAQTEVPVEAETEAEAPAQL